MKLSAAFKRFVYLFDLVFAWIAYCYSVLFQTIAPKQYAFGNVENNNLKQSIIYCVIRIKWHIQNQLTFPWEFNERIPSEYFPIIFFFVLSLIQLSKSECVHSVFAANIRQIYSIRHEICNETVMIKKY